jgi:hypothetical protein
MMPFIVMGGLMMCSSSSAMAALMMGGEEGAGTGSTNNDHDKPVFGNTVVAYLECDYKGENKVEFGGTPDFVEAEAGYEIPLKSIVIPEGFTVDTYSNDSREDVTISVDPNSSLEQGGVKKSYTGPHTERCVSFNRIRVRKE